MVYLHVIHMCVVYICHKYYESRGRNGVKSDARERPGERRGSGEWAVDAQLEGPRLGAGGKSGMRW